MHRGIVVVLLWGAASVASAQACPTDVDVPPWVSFDAGFQGPGSTSAPDVGTLTLCSSTDGFGDTTDHYRYAFQLRDHDFSLQAQVGSIDPGGSGGIVAVVPGVSSTHAARVAAEVYVTTGGSAVLRSEIRRASGGPSDASIAEMAVTLPVAIRLVREGNELRTEIAGGATHLTATLDPEGELMGPLRVGVAQASNDSGFARQASFSRLLISGAEPGADLDCVEALAAMSGSPFRMSGRHLDRIDGVRIAGMDATITTSSAARLVVEAPAMSGGFVHGPVEISQNGRFRRVGSASFVGTAMQRGDVDQDGEVGTEDYRRLCHHVYRGGALPECSAAGDVDADGDLDADDVDRLRRYLETGSDAPEAPFDTPGLVEGTLACGLPGAPEVRGIEFADGSPIDRPVRTGDDLAILGVGLPSPERALVRFGNTAAVPSTSDSTSDRLVVRVGTVLGGGEQCPRIFDAEPAPAGHTRFGPAFGFDDTSELCLEFEASTLDMHLSSRMVEDQLEISVPPTALRPGTRLRIALSLHLPHVVGQTRGPRDARFDFVVPNLSYEDALGALASRLAKAIHDGGTTDDCDCEVAPTDVVLEEKLILPPCALLPELPPRPTVPGLPTQIERTKVIWSQMDIHQDFPGPACDGSFTSERHFFWCQLEEVTQIQGADAQPWLQGLPLWESYEPPTLFVSPDPHQRSTHEKGILVDPIVKTFLDHFYDDPCEMALRATQCNETEFFATWMPKFGVDGKVIKTFWQPLSNLPASVDETALYSYDPPGSTPRQYLVGMHIGYSIGDIDLSDDPPDYFEWSTFWLPSGGDTTTKGGQPLANVHSPHCSVGHGADQPGSFEGTPFDGWHMCTDSQAGEAACGNPWEPGECPQSGPTSCTNCHITMGKHYWGGNDSSFDPAPLRMGWLTSLISAWGSEATACLVDIESSPGDFDPDWLTAGPTADAKNCSEGI